jgi:predicted dehydrogenase
MTSLANTTVAIVGMGPHGKRMLDAAVAAGLNVAAAIDRNDAALSSLDASIARASSLADAPACDVVCIATNGPSHAAIAVDAMQRGARIVVVAKPMACSLAECDAILEAAAKTGAVVVVDHVRRYSPGYVYLKQVIDSGTLGELRALWVQRPGIGLGCLATHSFDVVRFLTSSEVSSVIGFVDPPLKKNPRGEQFVDPGGHAVMTMTNGVRATVAQIEDGAGPSSLEVHGTAGRVRLDESSGAIEIIAKDLTVVPKPGVPARFAPVAVPDGITAKVDMQQGLVALLLDAVASRNSGARSRCDGREGRAAVAVLAAIHHSHRRNHAVVNIDDPDLSSLWLPVT